MKIQPISNQMYAKKQNIGFKHGLSECARELYSKMPYSLHLEHQKHKGIAFVEKLTGDIDEFAERIERAWF